MGLDGAIGVQGGFITDISEIKLAEVGRFHVHALADARAQEPEIPADKGCAGERTDQERFGQVLMQGIKQFIAPNETAPKRFLSRPVPANQQPFGGNRKNGACQAATNIEERKKEKR